MGFKTLIIGLDGAPPALIFGSLRQQLPNLGRLMETGVWGSLRSCNPPLTVPASAAMMTGKDPGQLGFYGFRNRVDRSYDRWSFASSESIGEDLLWDILAREGKRSVLVGVPQTYPPRPVLGALVSGFLTPSRHSAFTYPAELRAEVERVAPEYSFDIDPRGAEDRNALRASILKSTAERFRVARHLMSSMSWDFAAVVEMGVDRMQHGFWSTFDPAHPRYVEKSRYADAIPAYYHAVDGEIGALVETLDRNTVVLVVSDHGAQALRGSIAINEWLWRNGFLHLRESPSQPTPLRPEMVDWARTRAWAEGGYVGALFLNIRGREPEGAVAPADATRVLDEISAGLAALPGADGAKLATQCVPTERCYRVRNGIPPDLWIYLDNLALRAIGSVGHGSLYPAESGGRLDDATVDWDGFFILSDTSGGKRISARGQVDGVSLYDIAPTVLRLFGVPVPSEMRGAAMARPRDETE